MSYQETIVGNQIVYVFALAVLLVYLCLAGQYESWIAPLGVILAVPLALSGPRSRWRRSACPTTSTPRSA
jgi:HAE1 family hydrophobic/amphiphilic exporter-1